MIYKSYADLAATVSARLHLVAPDVDLIVGVPRSGMLAASIVALQLNRHLCDLPAFLGNVPLAKGRTRRAGGAEMERAMDARKVFVLDDSIASGGSMKVVRDQLAASGYRGEVVYAAVYATEQTRDQVDVAFEITGLPRIFQWNLFHRREAERYCVDIDGVLCLDPTADENDDGPRYETFLGEALTLARPSYRIGHLVTSRLERYRAHTERWLARQGIEYGQLHMLDVPTAEERRRLGLHGSFKASVYAKLPDAILFIESESSQADDICRRTGRPVLDYGRQRVVMPQGLTMGVVSKHSRRFMFRVKRKMATLLGAAR